MTHQELLIVSASAGVAQFAWGTTNVVTAYRQRDKVTLWFKVLSILSGVVLFAAYWIVSRHPALFWIVTAGWVFYVLQRLVYWGVYGIHRNKTRFVERNGTPDAPLGRRPDGESSN